MALPIEHEDRLAPSAVRHGHEIVARSATAHELAARIESLRPDIAVVAANERHLTDRLLSLCDDSGVRVVALVAGEVERRYAASLGLLETADAASEWSDLEAHLVVARAEASQADLETHAENGT